MNDVSPLRRFLAGDDCTAVSQPQTSDDEAVLLADEAVWCSHGDAVHYVEPPKLFERCDGSFMFDAAGRIAWTRTGFSFAIATG